MTKPKSKSKPRPKTINEIARMGGKALLEKRGKDHFRKMIQKRWENVNAKKNGTKTV
jgi:hypothetical protein